MKEKYEKISLEEAKQIMLSILKEIDKVCKEHNINYWLDGGTLLGAIRHKGFIPWDDDIDIAMLREDFEKFKKVAKLKMKEDFYLEIFDLENIFKGMPLKVRAKNTIYIEKWDKKNSKKKGIFIDVFPFDRFSLNKKELRKELFPKYLYQLKTMRFWIKGLTIKNILKAIAIVILKLIPNKYVIYLNKKYYLKSLKMKNNTLIGYGYGLTWRNVYNYKDIFPLKKAEFEKSDFPIPKNYDKVLKILYGDYMIIPSEKDRQTHSACIMKKIDKKVVN